LNFWNFNTGLIGGEMVTSWFKPEFKSLSKSIKDLENKKLLSAEAD
jgi:hypothetical protein